MFLIIDMKESFKIGFRLITQADSKTEMMCYASEKVQSLVAFCKCQPSTFWRTLGTIFL